MARDQEAALAELGDLGKSLAEAATDRTKQTGILRQILDLIGGLDKDDAKALFKNEKVQTLVEAASTELAQSSDDPPGTIYDAMIGGQLVKSFNSKPWTNGDLKRLQGEGASKMVQYTPRTTQMVGWNGLERHFVADEEMWVEQCFVDVYRDSLRAMKLAAEHVAYNFKKSGHLSDSSIRSDRGIRARATGDQGYFIPGGGQIAGRGAGEGEGESV